MGQTASRVLPPCDILSLKSADRPRRINPLRAVLQLHSSGRSEDFEPREEESNDTGFIRMTVSTPTYCTTPPVWGVMTGRTDEKRLSPERVWQALG